MSECFCDGAVKHEGAPCPLAPVPFVPARPDLALIRSQIDKGHVHLEVREGPAHARVRAGLASRRARTSWVITFQVEVKGKPSARMQKTVHRNQLEDELLELVLDLRRFDPKSSRQLS